MNPNRFQQTFMYVPWKRPKVNPPVLENGLGTVVPDNLLKQPVKYGVEQTSTENKNTSYMSIYL